MGLRDRRRGSVAGGSVPLPRSQQFNPERFRQPLLQLSRFKKCCYLVSKLVWGLVLPCSENAPSLVDQDLIGVVVSCPVRVELRLPPFGIRLRRCSVFRAPVPKAAVDEYGKLMACECDVDGSASLPWDGEVDSVAEASCVECGAKSQFGRCVSLFRLLQSRRVCDRARSRVFARSRRARKFAPCLSGRFYHGVLLSASAHRIPRCFNRCGY